MKTQSRMMAARHQKERGHLEVTANRFRVSFWIDRNVLELDSVYGCTILYMY